MTSIQDLPSVKTAREQRLAIDQADKDLAIAGKELAREICERANLKKRLPTVLETRWLKARQNLWEATGGKGPEPGRTIYR